MNTRLKATVATLALALLGWVPGAAAQAEPPAARTNEAKRVEAAAEVFQDIMRAPDQAIPQELLDRAEAIAVFPNVVKAAFVFGGERGKGIISVRNRAAQSWSAPAFLTLTAGSWGAQIGGQSADIVLVILNRRGVDKLMKNEFKIGGTAEAAAGPVGRQASAATDITMRAEILSYSRTRGLFAGVSLSGASIHEDADANEAFYGKPFRTRDIALGAVQPAPVVPQAIAQWRDTLQRYALAERAATSGRKDDK